MRLDDGAEPSPSPSSSPTGTTAPRHAWPDALAAADGRRNGQSGACGRHSGPATGGESDVHRVVARCRGDRLGRAADGHYAYEPYDRGDVPERIVPLIEEARTILRDELRQRMKAGKQGRLIAPATPMHVRAARPEGIARLGERRP